MKYHILPVLKTTVQNSKFLYKLINYLDSQTLDKLKGILVKIIQKGKMWPHLRQQLPCWFLRSSPHTHWPYPSSPRQAGWQTSRYGSSPSCSHRCSRPRSRSRSRSSRCPKDPTTHRSMGEVELVLRQWKKCQSESLLRNNICPSHSLCAYIYSSF